MAFNFSDTEPQAQTQDDESLRRKARAYDMLFGGGDDDARLTQAENQVVSDRSQPEAPYQRPKRSRAQSIFGGILEATRGGHYAGQRMLYEPQINAREDFDLANRARTRRDVREQQNVNTLTNQYNRQSNEAFKLQRQQLMLGKAESDIGKTNAQIETERARQDYLHGIAEKARRGTSKAAAPGSMIFQDTGQVTEPGDPNAYSKGKGTSVFGPYSPGQGLYNKQTGEPKVLPSPGAAAAAKGGGRGAASVLSSKAIQVEQRKTKALQDNKNKIDKDRSAIDKKWEGFDTTSQTFPDGSPNPYFGQKQRELDELYKRDTQNKNGIQRGYEAEMRLAGGGVQHYEYPPTTENMDPTGQADEAAMRPATGEEVDTERLKQELGPGEILVHDPDSGRYFAAHESQRDELETEGYEPID